MSDVLKSQGAAIRDLERQMPLKTSKSEFQSALNQKASLADLSQQASELAALVESRGPLLDLQVQIEQKVSRSDLSFLLANRPSLEEVKNMIEGKASLRELEDSMQTTIAKFEETMKDVQKRLANCVNDRDFHALEAQIQTKAALADMETALNEKASKQMVANALARKVNTADMENLLSKKADFAQLQSFLQVLDSKADLNYVEKSLSMLENKAESSDLASIFDELRSKATKRELNELQEGLLVELRENQRLSGAQTTGIDEQINNFLNEMERFRSNFTTALGKKADNKDLDRLMGIVGKKAEEERVMEVVRMHKAELGELILSVKAEMRVDRQNSDIRTSEKTQMLENDLKELIGEMSRLRSTCGEMMESRRKEQEEQAKYAKSLNSTLKLEFSNELFSLKDRVDSLTSLTSNLSREKANLTDLRDVKTQFQAALTARPSLDHLQGLLEELKSDFAVVTKDLREDYKVKIARLEGNVFESLEKKANFSEMQGYLGEKADTGLVTRLLAVKVTNEDFDDVKKTVDFLKMETLRKAERTELDLHIAHTRTALEEASKDIVLKANIKDVCSLLDQKASKLYLDVDDVNKALRDMHSDIDLKANFTDFKAHVNEQTMLNEALCGENMLGRWIWKSGEVRVGNAVPWEIQAVNTYPDNFLWEREKTAILTVAPGLYEVQFGFFSGRKPTVQLLVNGEVVLSAGSQATHVVHHTSGRIRSGGHSSGNVAGLTHLDYLALPSRARLSLTYTGDGDAEGFLGLRKL